MDAFDKFWFAVKRFFFPILLILAGIIFILSGISVDKVTGLTQTSYFLYGGIAVFVLGIVSFVLVLAEKIPIMLILGASILLALGVYSFTYFNVASIKSQIKYEEDVKESIKLSKQGLLDIQKLQEEYEKNKGKYAISFDSLIKFAKYDSTSVLVKAEGDVPTRRMTLDEAKKLGLREAKEVMSEEDALKLGLIVREFKKLPVAEYLFSDEKQKKNKRLYPFDIEKLTINRTIGEFETKQFIIRSAEIDSTLYGVQILALPPYGPQTADDYRDTLSIGSLSEKKMNSNWK